MDEYCEFDNTQAEEDFFMENPAFFEKIKLGIPFEYINYKSFFYKYDFYVNKDVLIPRSETEILVEDAIAIINQNYQEGYSICDIGTGSGIIPLTIASEIKNPLNIIASDISHDALEVAKINFDHFKDQFHKETNIHFEIRDRLLNSTQKFNLVLSNPPYIKEAEDKKNVHHQTDHFEPHLALYLKDSEYTQWFETLFLQVKESLYEHGLFLMEGHEDHLNELKNIAEKYFSKVIIKKDYTQRDRFLICNL